VLVVKGAMMNTRSQLVCKLFAPVCNFLLIAHAFIDAEIEGTELNPHCPSLYVNVEAHSF
jgi:hypothetical protein